MRRILAIVVVLGMVVAAGAAWLADPGDKGLERASWVAGVAGGLALCVAVIQWAFHSVRSRWLHTSRGFLGDPPRRVSTYVPRPDELNRIVRALKSAGGTRPVAVVGPGGVGKSTLCAAACYEIRRRFHAVTWLDAGSGAESIALIAQLARRLGVANPGFTTAAEGRDALAWLLSGQRVLIVLDNVSSRDVLDAFIGLAPVLFTTRSLELAQVVGADQVAVGELSPEQAAAVLSSWTGLDVGQLPDAARNISARLGNLALGVAMAGAMVARGRAWADVLFHVEHDLRRVAAEFDPGYGHPNLLCAVELGVDDLPDEQRRRYLELAVFSGRRSFPRDAIEMLWQGMSSADTGNLLAELTGRSLLVITSDNWYTAHDLQHEVLIERLGTKALRDKHNQLLGGYRTRYPTWADAACDRYLAANLAWHLDQAGRHKELADLLIDVRWMSARLSAFSLPELITDYEHAHTEHATLVRRALLLSARALTEDPRQLSGQLAGRLLNHPDPEIHNWAASLPAPDGGPWLVPLTPALRPASGPLEQVLFGHTQWVEAVFITPDGRSVVSGSYDGTVRVWDLTTGRQTACITIGRARRSKPVWLRAFALKSDGRHVVCSNGPRPLRVWDLKTGHSVPLARRLRQVNAITLTANGRHAVVAVNTRLRVWDLHNGRRLSTLDGHRKVVHAVAVTPDGRLAVSGGADTTVRVWELSSGRELACLTGHRRRVTTVAVTPDGRHALSVSDDGAAHVWDLGTRQQIARHRSEGPITAVAIAPDGKRVVSVGYDDSLRVWDLTTNRELDRLRRNNAGFDIATDVAVSTDGDHAVSGFADGDVSVWDLTRRSAAVAAPAIWVMALAITPDGRRVVSGGQKLQLIDLETGVVHDLSIEDMGVTWSLAITPDGSKVVIGRKVIYVQDLVTSQVAELPGHNLPVRAVVVTPDGSRVISSGEDHTIAMSDLRTKALIARVNVRHPVGALAVTKDGRRLITAARDGSLGVRDLDTLKEVTRVRTHAGWRVRSVALTPDGEHVLSCGDDATVRLWTVDLAEQVAVLKGHKGRVRSVTCTPDGRHVISTGSDRTVRAWNLRDWRQVARWDGDNIIGRCVIADGRPDNIVIAEMRGTVHVLRLCGVRAR